MSGKQPKETVLVAQLQQLNERSRWYATRTWQVPFIYIGLIGAVSGWSTKPDSLTWAALLLAGVFSCGLLVQMQCAIRDVVAHIRCVERHLALRPTAERRGIGCFNLAFALVATCYCLIQMVQML